MDDLLELAQRLDFAATCSDMGREPDHSSVTRRSAKALRAAYHEIRRLKAIASNGNPHLAREALGE